MSERTVTPPGRQGPGAVPGRLVERLGLDVARRAAGLLPGELRAPGAGLGTELAQLRAYRVGDDVRQLDAAATARTGEPHVRLQVPERALTTWLVVDVSPSMAFGSAQRLKSDVAEGAGSVVARLAVRHGGRLGVMFAGGPASRMLPPRSGQGAAAAACELLRRGVAADGASDPRDVARALERVRRLARPDSLVVVISDFRDAVGAKRVLAAIGARHSLVALEVTDPREASLPAVGHLSLVDPETGALVRVDTRQRALRERFACAEAERREQLRDELQRARAEHIVLSTEGDWLRDLGRRLR